MSKKWRGLEKEKLLVFPEYSTNQNVKVKYLRKGYA